jgi:hypothetical protein
MTEALLQSNGATPTKENEVATAKRKTKRVSKSLMARTLLQENPNISVAEFMRKTNTSLKKAYTLRWAARKALGITARETKTKETLGDMATRLGVTVKQAAEIRHKRVIDQHKYEKEIKAEAKPSSDPVNHPAHYKTGGIETIDFIEAKNLGYNLGNVVKYITRADHKGNKEQDLLKAAWYLQREIEHAIGAR